MTIHKDKRDQKVEMKSDSEPSKRRSKLGYAY